MRKRLSLLLAAVLLLSFTVVFAEQAAPATPKYVFFFIGDGMSSPHTTAAQYFLGAKLNPESKVPVMEPISFAKFPFLGQSFSFDATSFAPDSSSTATAMATGKRTLSASVNVGYKEGEKGLEPDANDPYKIVTEYAKEAGMKVGIITTVSLDHATPAAFYAKSAKRSAYYDIAVQALGGQLVDFLGGGGLLQPTGSKNDQKDLLEIAKENGFTLFNTNEDIRAIGPDSGRVLAISPELRDSKSMQYEIDRQADGANNLSLADMTAAGIRNLETNEKGFFMMIEGGKIDWAAHANDVVTLITDIYALADAVDEAVAFAEKHPDETLIVVTGDHETGGLSIGYALTKYDVHMEYLQGQKLSYVAMDALLKELIDKQSTFDEIMDAIKENYGLTREEGLPLSLTARDISQLSAAYTFGMLPSDLREGVIGVDEQLHYGTYNPMSVTACHILANKAGINFSSYSHTGLSLPVYAMGASAELFSGSYPNTDIFVRFMDAMNLSE